MKLLKVYRGEYNLDILAEWNTRLAYISNGSYRTFNYSNCMKEIRFEDIILGDGLYFLVFTNGIIYINNYSEVVGDFFQRLEESKNLILDVPIKFSDKNIIHEALEFLTNVKQYKANLMSDIEMSTIKIFEFYSKRFVVEYFYEPKTCQTSLFLRKKITDKWLIAKSKTIKIHQTHHF